MSDDGKKAYGFEGEKIHASWDGRLCIHVQECTRAKGEVFESGRKPWCDPDLGEADFVAEVVGRCPTGALSFERKDGGAAERPDPQNSVTVANNGPLYLRGRLEIDGAPADTPGVRFRAALCRCGRSKNKPFCDNTHENSGFRDTGAIGESGQASVGEGGALQVGRSKNGPLLLSGNFSLVSGAGRTAWHGTKAALCRCGASKNKPFCDGSHKSVRFEAD